jgi:hypothetical protein
MYTVRVYRDNIYSGAGLGLTQVPNSLSPPPHQDASNTRVFTTHLKYAIDHLKPGSEQFTSRQFPVLKVYQDHKENQEHGQEAQETRQGLRSHTRVSA